jgi:hypothetical protein
MSRFTVSAISLVALLLTLAAPANAQSDDGGMRIEVASAETRRPLAGIGITVNDRNGAAVTGTHR